MNLAEKQLEYSIWLYKYIGVACMIPFGIVIKDFILVRVFDLRSFLSSLVLVAIGSALFVRIKEKLEGEHNGRIFK